MLRGGAVGQNAINVEKITVVEYRDLWPAGFAVLLMHVYSLCLCIVRPLFVAVVIPQGSGEITFCPPLMEIKATMNLSQERLHK